MSRHVAAHCASPGIVVTFDPPFIPIKMLLLPKAFGTFTFLLGVFLEDLSSFETNVGLGISKKLFQHVVGLVG